MLYVPDSKSHAVISLAETTAVAVEFYPELMADGARQ